MSRDRLNVLVVGTGMYVCGRGTTGYGTILPALIQQQRAGLVGEIRVAGATAQGVAEFREKLGDLNTRLSTRTEVRCYPEEGSDAKAYVAALRDLPAPACAIIAVPDHLHAPVAEEAIRKGIPVLVVKPLAPTLEESRQLAALAREHGVYGAVEFHKRYDEANLLLRQAIADGRLGDLRQIVVEYSQRRTVRESFSSWLRYTNIFQYLGVHYVDLIHFLTGAHPVRLLATGQPVGGSSPWEMDVIQAVIEWRHPDRTGEFQSSVITGWTDPAGTSAMSDQKITVVGTAGRCFSDQKHRGFQLATDEGVEDINPYFSQIYRDGNGDFSVQGYGPRSIYQFLNDIEALRTGTVTIDELRATRPSFDQALVSSAVVDSVNRSLAGGGEWTAVEREPTA